MQLITAFCANIMAKCLNKFLTTPNFVLGTVTERGENDDERDESDKHL